MSRMTNWLMAAILVTLLAGGVAVAVGGDGEGGTVPIDPTRAIDQSSITTQVRLATDDADLSGVVPAEGVSALMLNVKVFDPSTNGYLAVYPCDAAIDLVSALTLHDGVTTQGAVLSKVSGADPGEICIEPRNSSHVLIPVARIIVYVTGYVYTPSLDASVAALSCGKQQVALYDGSAWQCSTADGRVDTEQIALLRWDAGYREIDADVGAAPRGIAFDGSTLWVSNTDDNDVSRIDTTTGSATGADVGAGSGPRTMAFDGTNIWVANHNGDSVSRIEAATGDSAGADIGVGDQPSAIAFDGTNIWVANYGDDDVSRIVAATGASAGADVAAGNGPRGLAFDGTNIWVANYGGDDVSRIVAATGASAGADVAAGNGPRAMAFDGTHVWVANQLDGTVTKILASDGSVADTVTVGTTPLAVAFDGTHLWVANHGDDTVTRLGAADGATAQVHPVGADPIGLAFDGTHMWVVENGDDTVTRLPAD